MPRQLDLPAVRRDMPVCRNYDNLTEVKAFERAVREHRAYSESHTLAPPGDGDITGAWRVSGPGRGEYIVDLVDGTRRHDTCTCPDYLWNELGTCKHLEAVQRVLLTVMAFSRQWKSLIRSGATRPTVTVDAVDGLELRLVGPWNPRLLGRARLSRDAEAGVVEVIGDSPLVPGIDSSGIRVVHAAPFAVDHLRARRERSRRRAAFFDAFDGGGVGVDVLRHPLFPYQRTGVAHLAGAGRAMLADDMGLGKTVQAIAACEVMRARGEASRIVIVTPASLKHQWAKEIGKYAGAGAAVVGGGIAGRREAFDSDAPYKILSYELTWRELSRLKALDADILVLDEAQRARNFRTKTAATLKAIPSRFLFVLTGTPVENRLDDLYSLMQIVDPEVLGPLWRFNHDFHKQGNRGKVLACRNLSRLRQVIEPLVVRRRKEEVLAQLPSLTEQTRHTAMTTRQADAELGCRQEAARYMAIAEKRPLTPVEQKKMLSLLLKARQACNAMELFDPEGDVHESPKLDEFQEVVTEIVDQGLSKILVFSEWTEMLKLAAGRLDMLGVGHTTLHGSIPAEKRPALLDRFREDPAIRVLLSTDAGGVGLNLQVANYVIHLDLPWNPAKLDQRTSRAHRLGQTRGVSAIYLCAEKGIERGIEATLAGKRAVRSAALDADSVVDEIEGQGFSVFLRQMKQIMDAADGRVQVEAGPESSMEVRVVEADVVEELPEPAAPVLPTLPAPAVERAPAAVEAVVAAPPVPAPVPAPPSQPTVPGPSATGRTTGRARDRLRLARVVLDAGFSSDSVRASYDALATAIAGLIDGPAPRTHAELVAAIYRDLLPAGRLAPSAPGTLARLHDLTVLEEHGVEVEASLARSVLDEAAEWVERMAGWNDRDELHVTLQRSVQ